MPTMLNAFLLDAFPIRSFPYIYQRVLLSVNISTRLACGSLRCTHFNASYSIDQEATRLSRVTLRLFSG